MEQYYSTIERVYDLSVFTMLIPAVAAAFKWRFFEFSLKLAAIHTFRGAIISLTALAFYYQNYTNRPLYYISSCLDIILMSLLVSYILNKKKYSLLLFSIVIGFVLLMIYDYFNDKKELMINSVLMTFETVFVVAILLICLKKISDISAHPMYNRSMVWILSALIIGNLFSVLLSSFNQKVIDYSNDFFVFLWYLLSPIIIIATNAMLTYGISQITKTVKLADRNHPLKNAN